MTETVSGAAGGGGTRDTTFHEQLTMSKAEDTQLHVVEAEDYEFTVPPRLAPKLVRLLDLVADADDQQSALYFSEDDCKEMDRLHDSLEEQIRNQGFTDQL